MVIHQKNKIKKQVSFAIGHSASEHKTFLPDKVIEKSTGFTFIDTAAINDEAEGVLQLVNVFNSRYIFKNAKKVRILMTITPE